MGRWIPNTDWTVNANHGVPIEYAEADVQALIDTFNARPNRYCDYRLIFLLDKPEWVNVEFRDRLDRTDHYAPQTAS